MPFKDAGMRKKAVRDSMRKLRGMVELGDVNPEYVNPEECEPLCEPLRVVRKPVPDYSINVRHLAGCVCMLCAPNRWPDLKLEFTKQVMHRVDAGRRWYPNYDIHPAHAESCDCMCCLDGVRGKDGKFRLMKDMLASA